MTHHESSAAPTVDFDIDGPGAGLLTLGLLLLPRDTRPEERLHAAEQWLRLCYQKRMVELGEKAFFEAEARAEEKRHDQTLDSVFAELGFKLDSEQFFAPFAIFDEAYDCYSDDEYSKSVIRSDWWRRGYLALSVEVNENVDRHRFVHSTGQSDDWQQYRAELQSGDLHDFLDANGYKPSLINVAMAPGLTLLVVASLLQHHRDRNPTRSLARQIIWEASILDHGKRKPRRQRALLPRWKALAPLWAGVIIEADCWNARNLIDVARLEKQIIEIVANTDRRRRIFGYANWLIANLRPARKSPKPIIDKTDVIRIPGGIPPLPPKLPRLDGLLPLKAKLL
jgi:hypothetical protein